MTRPPAQKRSIPGARSFSVRIHLDLSPTRMTGSSRLTRILSMTDQIARQLHGLHFSSYHPPDPAWRPAVNVYAYADRLEVCMDLAGVEKEDIRVDVEPRRISVSGHREFPESHCEGPGCARILMMEIEDGRFARTLEFPIDIDVQRVQARQENGWLWIVVPKAQQGGAA
jgi:HSP20 family protein